METVGVAHAELLAGWRGGRHLEISLIPATGIYLLSTAVGGHSAVHPGDKNGFRTITALTKRIVQGRGQTCNQAGIMLRSAKRVSGDVLSGVESVAGAKALSSGGTAGERAEAAPVTSLSLSRSVGSPPTMWRRIILNTAEVWHWQRDEKLQALSPGWAGSGARGCGRSLRAENPHGLWRAGVLPRLIYRTLTSSWGPLRRLGPKQQLLIK